MKAAEASVCSPLSQVTPERKIEHIIRTRSQAAKALLLERSAQVTGSAGPLASQSGTAGASAPKQPRESQPKAKERPLASQSGTAGASPPMQPQEINPEPKERPLASQSGTAEAPAPMQPRESQPKAKERPLASRSGTAGASAPTQPRESQPEPKERPLASQSGTAGASPPTQPRESQPEAEQRLLQGWETEFQEFLEAEEAAWEEQLLMELNPWANTAAFLASFEQVALACRWPQREWVVRLLPALSEDAEKAFVSLDPKDQGDFRKVKAAILQREALGRDRKRQAFRRFCYQEASGPGEVCARLQELCHRWLKVEQSTKEQILDLLILEQFMNVLPKEMQNWVKERGPDTCVQAVALAEDFLQRLQAADQGKEQEPETTVGSPPKTGGTQLEVTPVQFQAKWDEKGSSSTLQRTYPAGYRKTRASKKRKNVQLHQYEDTKLRARFPGKANTIFPLLLKQEGAAEDCRRSERLRRSQVGPVHEEPSSPPTKICKKLEKPSLPQGTLPDLRKSCAECGQSFNGLASFMRHKIVHTGEKRYECCFCGKGFCWRSDLVRHECIHTGKMPHECTYCGQGFDRKWKRKQHEQEHLKSKALI